MPLQWGRNFIVAEIHKQGVDDHDHAHASMGPQLYRCGNQTVDDHAQGRHTGFNGAATLSLRKWVNRRRKAGPNPKLQWGRNFIVAEMFQLSPKGDVVVHASMGPQLYRCGNDDSKVQTSWRECASMGPQLYRCGNLRSFCPLRARLSSFNGAATLSLRKYDHRPGEDAPLVLASMGPQLYRCGNAHQTPKHPQRGSSFNGAATLSLRKCW